MKELEEYIHLSKYSKFVDKLGRRETWEETVQRYIDFWKKRYTDDIKVDWNEIQLAILKKEVMPSMRAFMTAGKALERCNSVGYNCAATAVNNQRAFDEHFYLLMGGAGMGFSVERQYINQMPTISDEMHDTDTTIVVRDSRAGWAKALKELIALLYNGNVPRFDVLKVRKEGERLKTMGGRASGPRPLLVLFEYTIRLFKNAKGRKLNSTECHKLMCKIAETVIVGSVRRSAAISFGNLTDDRHRRLKTGEFWLQNPELFLSNNSVMYTEKPDIEAFTKEFRNLYKSRAGERGIVNQEALKRKAEACGREHDGQYLLNPCAETILRDTGGICNLSEVVVRTGDTLNDLREKVRIATIIGTLQSTLTNFKYLRKIWKKNAEEERLLGVSLTGIMDHEILSNPEKAGHYLSEMKKIAKKTNKKFSKILKIGESKQLTLVKPSGCRPSYSLINSDNGIMMLDEFEYGNNVFDWLDVKNIYSADYGKITKTYNNGVANIKRISLSYGMEIESTDNHKWFVNGKGWTRTDEILENDEIVYNISSYKSNKSSILNVDNGYLYNNANMNVSFPHHMSPDFAWLIGYIYGDGAMCEKKSRFRFVDGYKPSIKKAQRLFKKFFNINGKIKKLKNRNAFSYEIASRKLWNHFKANGLVKTKSSEIDRIPLIIRQSSEEDIISFICGLIDSDGCVSRNIMYTTANGKFGKHIQNIAMSVGLVFGRSKNINRSGSFSKKHVWLMSLSLGSSNENVKFLFKNSIKCSNFTGNRDVGKNRSKTYKVGLVKSICDIGQMETFDVETEDHWFWAGGFMSHNTVSLLASTASGIHPRYAKYYIRRVTQDKKDPLTAMMISEKIPYVDTGEKVIFSFPIKSPENSKTKMTTKEQLDLWLVYRKIWCDGNPSQTIYYNDDTFLELQDWIWKNWDQIGGLSFFPKDDNVYENQPFEEITENEYSKLKSSFPKINWNNLKNFEKEDNSVLEIAVGCSGGTCEL